MHCFGKFKSTFSINIPVLFILQLKIDLNNTDYRYDSCRNEMII